MQIPRQLAAVSGGTIIQYEALRRTKRSASTSRRQKWWKKTDYCGLVSGRDTDKAALFDVYYGELKTAPMITECPLSLECGLEITVENPTNNFYIGEIIASYTEEKYLTGGETGYNEDQSAPAHHAGQPILDHRCMCR